jgi:hypothetical protein
MAETEPRRYGMPPKGMGPMGLWYCPDCGVLVMNTQRHNEWHTMVEA